MIYEELEEVINNIFASRAKSIQPKTVSVWAKEISSRGFYDQTIKEVEKTLMEDDEIPLTLARFINLAKEFDNRHKSLTNAKIKCDYCGGGGIAGLTLFFANSGKYLSQNYALRCHHNENEKTGILKMDFNEEINNRTVSSNGYFLVFKYVLDRDEYIKKVFQNKGYDLWVNQKEIKGEDFN